MVENCVKMFDVILSTVLLYIGNVPLFLLILLKRLEIKRIFVKMLFPCEITFRKSQQK